MSLESVFTVIVIVILGLILGLLQMAEWREKKLFEEKEVYEDDELDSEEEKD